MKKKAVISLMIFVLVAVASIRCGYANVEISEDVFSALLMDKNSGGIIYEKNSNEHVNVFGLNKLMGAYLILEMVDNGQIKMSDQVIVGESAREIGGTVAFLEIGSNYSVEELLKAVIVANANDAMIALAEKHSGNVDTFINQMNEKAGQLNMNNTKFKNVTGFNDQEQLTTANDLGILAREILNHNEYLALSDVYMYELVHPSGRITEIVNTNKLVNSYDMVDGMMTGSNGNAEYSIVATAKKGNFRVIAIALNVSSADVRSETARTLIDYGFANFLGKVMMKQGDLVKKDIEVEGSFDTVNAVVDSELSCVLEKGSEKNVSKEISVYEELTAPIKEGDVIGEAKIYLNNDVIGSVPLVAQNSVEKSNFSGEFSRVIKKWLGL